MLHVPYDLPRSHSLIFAITVEPANLIDCHAAFFGNRLKRVSFHRLVIHAFRLVGRAHGVGGHVVLAASGHAVYLIARVSAVAHFATLATHAWFVIRSARKKST